MENLIEKSYEIDPGSYSVTASGEEIPHYRIITIKIQNEEEAIHYDIRRCAIRNGCSLGHINSRRYSNSGYNEKNYWKIYHDNDKFEKAIKRIEKMISK
jgi:hypothetical protein